MTPSEASGVTVLSVYQPIVELGDGSVVAVEALARGGPDGTVPPHQLFSRAAGHGSLEALDEACLRAALDGVRTSRGPVTVFVNIEPPTLSALSSRRLAELGELAPDGVQVVLEVTERDLLERPAELVRGVRGVRDIGWGVALDDVGAEPMGLALMPFLRPDVIKLDLALVRDHTTLQAAAVLNAVRAEAERSGAVLLAEGIEDEEHLERALAMGARLGQGWMFGRPGPLPLVAAAPLRLPAPHRPDPSVTAATSRTPYELLSALSVPRRAAVPLLASMTRQVERQAMLLDEQTVVLANFQHAQSMTAATRRRYESLASVSALTAVLGAAMPDEPAPGVHGTALAAGDPLAEEWVVTVIGPHFAAALAAREVGLSGEDDDGSPTRAGATSPPGRRRLDYVLTYDRQRVLDAAGLLLERVRPRPTTAHRGTAVRPAASTRLSLQVSAADLPEVLLRAIATASSGIVISDARLPDQPLVYANEAFLRLTGYAEDEVLGRNCRFLQGPDTDQSQLQPLRRRILAGRDVHTVLLNYRRDGSAFWNEIRVSPVRDRTGLVTHHIGHQLDVTARVDRERRTAFLAYHDELTGLPNRAQVLEHLDLELRRARRSGKSVATVMLDLDGFKAINDRLGHAAGDSALVWAAGRLRSAVRSGDLLGRLGGDEFLVVLAELPGTDGLVSRRDGVAAADDIVRRVQQHLHASLDEPLDLAGRTVRLRASSGAALFPRDAPGPGELLAQADAAMYRDKSGG